MEFVKGKVFWRLFVLSGFRGLYFKIIIVKSDVGFADSVRLLNGPLKVGYQTNRHLAAPVGPQPVAREYNLH